MMAEDEAQPKGETGGANANSGGYLNWFQNAYSQSFEVWDQIKRDFSEVATAVTKEPLSAVERTASSVYRQISDVAHSLQEGVAPLPEEEPQESFDSMEFPIPDVKAALSEFVGSLEKRINNLTQGAFGNLIKNPNPGASADGREARIGVIRADPATFEQLPPAPQPGVLSYTDWRSAYFDEDTCTPRPGIPIPDSLTKPTGSGARASACVAPEHAPPAQVLEESPAVRSHLLRLVDPDAAATAACSAQNASEAKLLTEADFWSRYYYRLWLLDVAEVRRLQISGSLTGTTDGEGSATAAAPGTAKVQEESAAEDMWPVLEEVADGEPATPTSLARTPVASDFTFKKPKDVTPEPEETPAHQTTSPKPDSELPPPKLTPSVAEPQEKKSGQSSFAASSPASSIVVLNSDDAEDVDEGGQYHPQLPSTESALADQSDQPADGDWEDYDIALTEQDIKEAEKEMQSRLQADSATTEASGDASDWEKWT